jgi:hypothetical protein
MVKPTFANGTAVYLDPAMNGPSDFTVNVMVADVVDLYGYQFKVYFDPNVLAATGDSIGNFFPTPPGYVVWKNEIGWDYVSIAVTRPLGTVSGKSGSGILASIDFVVIGGGSSYLQLENVKMTNPRAVEIEHTSSWGYFSAVTPAFDAYLTRRRNYNRPEHNLFKLSTDGEFQTLMAGCGNGGNVPVRVLVTWTITDVITGEITRVSTSKILAVGEETVVSYVVPAVLGSYAVQLSIEYDSVGDGTFGAVGAFESGEGGGGGTYEFTVVP